MSLLSWASLVYGPVWVYADLPSRPMNSVIGKPAAISRWVAIFESPSV